MHRKPVVILDPWDDFADLRTLVDGLLDRRMVRAQAAADVTWAATVEEALTAIERAWSQGEGRGAPLVGSSGYPDEWLEAD